MSTSGGVFTIFFDFSIVGLFGELFFSTFGSSINDSETCDGKSECMGSFLRIEIESLLYYC